MKPPKAFKAKDAQSSDWKMMSVAMSRCAEGDTAAGIDVQRLSSHLLGQARSFRPESGVESDFLRRVARMVDALGPRAWARIEKQLPSSIVQSLDYQYCRGLVTPERPSSRGSLNRRYGSYLSRPDLTRGYFGPG